MSAGVWADDTEHKIQASDKQKRNDIGKKGNQEIFCESIFSFSFDYDKNEFDELVFGNCCKKTEEAETKKDVGQCKNYEEHDFEENVENGDFTLAVMTSAAVKKICKDRNLVD